MKIMVLAAGVCALATGKVWAQDGEASWDEEEPRYYVNFGAASIGVFSSAYVVRAGRFYNERLAAELELGIVEEETTDLGIGYTEEENGGWLGAYLTAYQPLGSRVRLFGRGGIASGWTNYRLTVEDSNRWRIPPGTYDEDEGEFGAVLGVGIEFDITDTFGVRTGANWSLTEEGSPLDQHENLSISAVVRF